MAVLQRLRGLEEDYEAARRQVEEIKQAAEHGYISLAQVGSVVEGLHTLSTNVQRIRASTSEASVDHIGSGREEAGALAEDMTHRMDTLLGGIQELVTRLTTPGWQPSPQAQAPGSREAHESEVALSRQDAVDPHRMVTATDPHGPPLGASLSFISEASMLEPMMSMSSVAEMDTADMGEAAVEGPEMMLSDTELYSWGRADLGCLFIDPPPDGQPEKPMEPAPVRSKYSRKNFTCLSTSLYHTVASTTTGEVYGSGQNEDGQVLHDRSDQQANVPLLVEPLLSQRVIQVSCGDNHTACLVASGGVITFGNNEVGQLGHSKGAISRIGPRTVVGLSGKVVKQVSCGYLFSLALTSEGEVFSWGVGGCVGHPDGDNRYTAEKIASLRFVPVAYLAAGYSHSLAVTVSGQAWGWGHNSHGQTGTAQDGGTVQVQEPLMVQGTSTATIVSAACGQSHSVLISKDGEVFACGRNNHGQCALPNITTVVRGGVIKVPSLAGIKAMMAACGNLHTLILTRDKRVLAFGQNQNGQLGLGMTGEEDVFEPREVVDLSGKHVYRVEAGGDQSFALCLSKQPEASLDEKTMDLIRKFSVVKPATSFFTAAALQSQIESVDRGHGSVVPILRTVQDLFSSISLVNGSFFGDTASRVDVMGLEGVYCSLMKLGDSAILQKMMQAFTLGINKLAANVENLTDPDSLRCVLMYWQCPLNSNTILSHESFLQLAQVLVRLPPKGRQTVLRWISQDYPGHIFATRLVKPLHQHLSKHLSIDFGKGMAVPMFTVIMSWLNEVNERSGEGKGIVPYSQFYNNSVSDLSQSDLGPNQLSPLLNDLMQWKQWQARDGLSNKFFFCSYPFLLNTQAKRWLLEREAQIEQTHVMRQDMLQSLMSGRPNMPFLVLRVTRGNLLESSIGQINAMMRTVDLRKPLKVVFMGEEGVDEGGVRKEFFQLLVEQLFAVDFGMFVPTDSKRELWFNKDCTWNSDGYMLIGVLLGLAIYNSTLLDLHFPLAVYKKLLGIPLVLNDLEDIDDELMTGLKKLLQYTPGPGGATVQDVFCLNFEVTWNEFSMTKSYELKPGGKDIEVSMENRQEYVDLYVRWVLDESIREQFNDFHHGFKMVMGSSSISLLRPEELELLVCGTPHLDLHELEKVAKYEGGYHADHPVIKRFWEVVHEMDTESQRKLLMFVTGSMKAPIGGLSNLNFLIQRNGPDSEMCPTASTCFNTLLLPEYNTKFKLHRKLYTAISECQGFGLK